MDWGAIIIAALSGGAVVKLLDLLVVRLNLKSSDTATAMQVLIARINTLNTRVDTYEKQIKDLESERLETNEKLNQARKESAEKDIRIKTLERENQDLKAELQRVHNQLEESNRQIEHLEKQVLTLLARVDELAGRSAL